MSLRAAGTFIGAWVRSRNLDRLRDRAHLEFLQQQWTDRLLQQVASRSPYYQTFAGKPLDAWPIMEKGEWMARFDEINTVGARLAELNTFAANAEATRNFSPTWHGHTVGFSTGTSGHRGLFFVSPEERARWAGTLFGRMLRINPLREERLALVLRAGSPLYERASTLRLRFRYFDQAQPWQAIVSGLQAYRPTILVAPARVLALLARDAARLRPRRVISVAEVLDDLDRARIEAAFGVRAEQIYQATEGLLGTTCESGTLHLMEPYVLIEPQWLDAERTRFTPLVTDLWRRTQPVIRYRMNDVLRVKREPCPCGRAAHGHRRHRRTHGRPAVARFGARPRLRVPRSGHSRNRGRGAAARRLPNHRAFAWTMARRTPAAAGGGPAPADSRPPASARIAARRDAARGHRG